jgi:DNA-directed RNA polymerase specialized sigma24 family protein
MWASRRSFRDAALLVGGDAAIGEPDVDDAWRFVPALPTPQRAVVVLRFYEEVALADIAVLLDRPPSTARSDLRRALTKLRESLT